MLKKITSILLAVLFVFQIFPCAFAHDVNQNESSEIFSKITSELIDRRTENTKSFAMNDGQLLKAEYPLPVHHKGSDGSWQDIYGNRKGGKIEFANFADSEKTVLVSNHNAAFSWGYVDCKKSEKKTEGKSEVKYKNIYENVDLEYKLSEKKLKENLILNSSDTQKEFEINYQVGNLKAIQTDEKTVELSNHNEKTVFKISAPEMIDSKNAKSDSLSLKILDQKAGKLKLKLTCDKNWIEDKERAYPITIDPDYKDEYFDFTVSSSNALCTNYRKKDTATSVFLDLTGSDFKGIGIVRVSVFGRSSSGHEMNCTYKSEYYLLEAGKKYELYNAVHESGCDEVQIRFAGCLSQRVCGKWSPDYKPDPQCLRIGDAHGTVGNTTNQAFDYAISPQGECWTTFRTKANSSSVYLNLEDTAGRENVKVRIFGVGGGERFQNCTNNPEMVYELQPGKKYELYNTVKENGHEAVQLQFSGTPGTRVTGKWSPDYSPESGCIPMGKSGGSGDGTLIRPITSPQALVDVPQISQNPEFPSGCEPTSAVMVLHFYDHGVSLREFIDKYLIRKSIKEGPDPNCAFVGSPTNSPECGYGCFSPCIAKAMNKVLQGCRAEVIRGQSLKTLSEEYTSHNVPVLIWATMGMRKIKAGTTWTIGYTDENAMHQRGERFTWPGNEHCVVLIGFNEKDYFVNDPLQSPGSVRGAYEKNLLEERFRELGSQAVVVRRHSSPPSAPISESRPVDLKQEILSKVCDFAQGVVLQASKNATEPLFLVVGTIANRRDIQDLPRRVEAIDIGDQRVYVMGKTTGDIVSAITGITQSVLGLATIVGGIGGGTMGIAASSTGIGTLVGIPVIVVSGGAVAAGSAQLAQGVGVMYSSIGNLSKDLGELHSSRGGHLSNQDYNRFKEKVLSGEDVIFKTKEEALEFIRRKFPDLKQEISGSRGSEGWHFDTHVIEKYGSKPIEHINLYSKDLKFRVHLLWRK